MCELVEIINIASAFGREGDEAGKACRRAAKCWRCCGSGRWCSERDHAAINIAARGDVGGLVSKYIGQLYSVCDTPIRGQVNAIGIQRLIVQPVKGDDITIEIGTNTALPLIDDIGPEQPRGAVAGAAMQVEQERGVVGRLGEKLQAACKFLEAFEIVFGAGETIVDIIIAPLIKT